MSSIVMSKYILFKYSNVFYKNKKKCLFSEVNLRLLSCNNTAQKVFPKYSSKGNVYLSLSLGFSE